MKVGDKVKVIKLLNDSGLKITPIPEIVSKEGVIKNIIKGFKAPYTVLIDSTKLVCFRKKELKKIK